MREISPLAGHWLSCVEPAKTIGYGADSPGWQSSMQGWPQAGLSRSHRSPQLQGCRSRGTGAQASSAKCPSLSDPFALLIWLQLKSVLATSSTHPPTHPHTYLSQPPCPHTAPARPHLCAAFQGSKGGSSALPQKQR